MSRLSVLALIPARGGSKRVPGKNMRRLGDAPLVEWTFAAARASTSCARILLSSDDDELLALGQSSDGIEILRRPVELASDTASSVDMALHALDCERDEGRLWDILVLLQPTSPFRADGRIEEGLALLTQGTAPAVVGVRLAPIHPHYCYFLTGDGGLEPAMTHGQDPGRRSQELRPAFCLTGGFYAIRSDILRRERSFVPLRTLPLVCNAAGEDIDIDTPEDFARAEEFVRDATRGIVPQ